jgi:hypothetical protein
MSLPFHHSVTQDYLRAWGHAPKFKAMPGFLRYPNGSVIPKENISIRRTAGEFGLYRFTNVDQESANLVEREFLTPHVDHPGHAVLSKLRQGGNVALTDGERWDFAVFLNALNVRTPKMVDRIRRTGVEVLQAELARDPERYESMRKPGMPETAEGFLRMIAPAFIENAGMFVFSNTVMNPNLVTPIFHMRWMIMLVPEGVSLLTSDNPMWASGRPDDPRCLITLPLSPSALFVATNAENVPFVRSEQAAVIADLSNRSQCQGAQRFVYGRSTLEFVRDVMNANRASPGSVERPATSPGTS